MKRRRWMILLILVLIFCVLTVFVMWLNKPVSSPVNIKPAEAFNKTEQPPPPIPIDTAYFSTTIPIGFVKKAFSETSVGPQLIQALFNYDKPGGGQMALTLGILPTDGIKNIADYNYRIKNPDLFTHIQFAGMPVDADSFFSTSGDNELTVFWAHGSLYAMISVSGPDSYKSAVRGALTNVLDRWQWK